ncbi:MAG: hypothetical protein RLZ75_1424, partial [Pseudomonadota bacterium]
MQITKNVPQDGLLNGGFGCGLNGILMALALTLTFHTSVAETAPVGKKILNSPAPKGMVLIPGGVFLMGSDKAISRPDERPVHQVKVDPFWMDTTEVTNAQFKSFVEATHYVTT